MRTLIELIVVVLAFAVFLAGCDSPEERAEEHYKNGMVLLQEGKLEQAGIEFRNALQENNAHEAARLELARVLEKMDNPRAAIGQYLAVVQQDEKNGPAHLALARLAVNAGDFQSASTQARRAFELLPQDPAARALMASVEFREGDKDAAARMAREVLADAPDSIPARLVVVADRMGAKDFTAALQSVDAGLKIAPDSADLHLARLASLESEGDKEAVGRQLQDMVERFPENEGFRRALLQWYIDQKDVEGAVAVMRKIADRTPDDPTGYLNVAQLILQTSGPEAARAELQHLVDTQKDPTPFMQALAQLDFHLGNRDAAIAALRKLAQGGESSPEKRDIQIALAKMLLQTGASDEANALVDAVLKEDDRHVEALKLRARRLIEQDATEEALRDLEVANQEKPDNPEILTIMAAAHDREGAHELAGQRLNQAMDASDHAPAESARYARFLLADQRYSDAEGVLLDALRRAPNNLDLLALLGQTYLQRQDWARAREIAARTQAMDVPRAKELGPFPGSRRAPGPGQDRRGDQTPPGRGSVERRHPAAPRGRRGDGGSGRPRRRGGGSAPGPRGFPRRAGRAPDAGECAFADFRHRRGGETLPRPDRRGPGGPRSLRGSRGPDEPGGGGEMRRERFSMRGSRARTGPRAFSTWMRNSCF